MMRFAVLAVLFLSASAAALRAADQDSAPTERLKVLKGMERADGYALEVTVKGVEGVARLQIKDIRGDYKPFSKKLAADQWVADVWTGIRIIPYVLTRACGSPERGSVQVNVILKDRKGAYTFQSRGLAEDIYILQSLPCKERYADWLKKAVPTSKDVLLSRQNFLQPPYAEEASEEFQQARAKQQKVSKVEMTTELEPAVTLAKAKYDERRAELIGRLCRSLLFYPEAKNLKWACERDGDQVFVSASCVDRMYWASFTVELERADGKWQYRRLLGSEVCKGD